MPTVYIYLVYLRVKVACYMVKCQFLSFMLTTVSNEDLSNSNKGITVNHARIHGGGGGVDWGYRHLQKI